MGWKPLVALFLIFVGIVLLITSLFVGPVYLPSFAYGTINMLYYALQFIGIISFLVGTIGIYLIWRKK